MAFNCLFIHSYENEVNVALANSCLSSEVSVPGRKNGGDCRKQKNDEPEINDVTEN